MFGILESNLGVSLLKRHCGLSGLFMQMGYKMQFPKDPSKSCEAGVISCPFLNERLHSLPFTARVSKKYLGQHCHIFDEHERKHLILMQE